MTEHYCNKCGKVEQVYNATPYNGTGNVCVYYLCPECYAVASFEIKRIREKRAIQNEMGRSICEFYGKLFTDKEQGNGNIR